MDRVGTKAVVLALLVLTGCSGGDDSDQAAPSTTSAVEGNAVPEPERSVGPFCAPAEALGEGFADLDPGTDDPSALREQFDQAREVIAQTQAEAPEEVRDEVAVLAEGYEEFLVALEAADYDFTQLSLSALTALDSPEMDAASERLDAYRIEACGEGVAQ